LSERIARHKAVLESAKAKQARAQARLEQVQGRLAIEEAYERAIAAVACWLREGVMEAISRYNPGP